jgi:hypothetical protein
LLLKLWCKGKNFYDKGQGINAEPLTSLSYEGLLPLDGKVIKEINKNIELNTSEAYLTGNLVLDIANQ